MQPDSQLTYVNVASPPFLPETKIPMTKVCLVYNAGGIGDYIHWTTAIRYVIDTYPYTYGYIYAPEYFLDLANLWLADYAPDRFKIITGGKWAEHVLIQDIPCIAPNLNQYANATGFHLFEIGYIIFNQKKALPKEEKYLLLPQVRGDEADVSRFSLPEKYVVVTTEATAENRRLPARTINGITKWLKERGVTPVFIGKTAVTETYKAEANYGVSTYGVIDLRDKTNLVEAACVLAKAKAVCGLDNGLIHLACCSSVPVVMYFTNVDPALRVPRRRPGEQTYVMTPDETLPCRFCNTNHRYMFGGKGNTCIYPKPAYNQCCRRITAEHFIERLEKVLT